MSQSELIGRTPEKSEGGSIWTIFGFFVIAMLFWFFVLKEDDEAPSVGGGAAGGGAAGGGCKAGEEMVGTKCLVKCTDGQMRVGEVCRCADDRVRVGEKCLIKCADGQVRVGEVCKDRMLKIQTMNNTTMHTVTHGTKDIELGSLLHSGILKGIKLTADAKEQGWGSQCSLFELNVMRGGKSIASINQKLGRNKEYKSFSLEPVVIPGTLVQEGDSVRVTIKGLWPRCAIWIKDIVAEVRVLV